MVGLGAAPRPHFCPENLHFSKLRPYNIQLNGIISSPYPELTLDIFGFPVCGRLITGRAVFRPRGWIWPLTNSNMVFWPKILFLTTFINIDSIFVESNGQSKIVSLCRAFRAFWQINSTASWPTVPPPPPCLVFLVKFSGEIFFLHFFDGKSIYDAWNGF